MADSILNYPHSISSETVEGLGVAMLENNKKDNIEYSYFSIVHDGRRFHAFYIKKGEENFPLKKEKQNKKSKNSS